MWQTRARVAVTFATESLANTIPQALIIAGIAAAGLFVAWVFIRIGDWISKRSTNYKSKWRVFFMLLAMATILISLTIGFNAAGFNFWTVALGYGFIAILISSGFGSALQSMFAYFLISLTKKIEELQHVEIVGSGLEGIIESVNFLWVDLSMLNPVTKRREITQVPTYMFLNGNIRFKKDKKRSTTDFV